MSPLTVKHVALHCTDELLSASVNIIMVDDFFSFVYREINNTFNNDSNVDSDY